MKFYTKTLFKSVEKKKAKCRRLYLLSAYTSSGSQNRSGHRTLFCNSKKIFLPQFKKK